MTEQPVSRRLEGKVAVVTGSARGIGAAISRRLSADGAGIVVHYFTREAGARAVVDQLRRDGGVAEAVCADLTDRDQLVGLFEAAEAIGGLDILVNNAAIAEFVPLVEITDVQVEQHMNVNFRSPLWAMQEAATRMRDEGRIINISGLGTSSPLREQTVYSASKAAMEQLSLQGAVEFAARGITVNSVCPGPTETELFWEAVPSDIAVTMSGRSHFKRLGRPDDIADVVAFLASDDGRWVTGQRLVVAGGAW